jgi:nitroreductase
MDVYEALYTTRAMRRVTPEPIPMDVQARILDAAVRAPSGGNTQNWRFLLVDSPEVKAELAPLYQQAIAGLWSGYYKDRIDAAHADPGDPESVSMLKVQRSAQWLADHFEEVPLYLFGFTQHDTSGSSIYPAMWSAQLAARAEGVGTSLTQALAFFNDQTLEILGVPQGEGWHMAGCVSFGYPTGRWGVAQRQPARQVSFRNRWGEDVGFADDGPLWPDP